MKYLLSALLLCLGCGGCAGADPQPVPVPTQTVDVETLRATTVAFLEEGSVYCAGVWVGPAVILTAAHCTAAEQQVALDTFAFAMYEDMGARGGREQTDPAPRTAYLMARDEVRDLALLTTDPQSPHPVAQLGPVPASGGYVYIVGHTVGLPYTYTPGSVSGLRYMIGPDPIVTEVLQVFSGATGGNSGGGMFDSEGRLVGICSYGRVPWIFGVSSNIIAGFILAG